MKKSIILFCAVGSLLVADSVIDIAPISITATGIDEKVIEQPLSIATKDEKEIQLDQVIFQKDLLNSLSGVRIEQTGSVIGHMTSIRMQSIQALIISSYKTVYLYNQAVFLTIMV